MKQDKISNNDDIIKDENVERKWLINLKNMYKNYENGIIFFIIILLSSTLISTAFALLLKFLKFDELISQNKGIQLLVSSLIVYVIGILVPSLIYIKVKGIHISIKTSFKNIILCILIGLFIQPIGTFLNMFGDFFTDTNNVTEMIYQFSNTNAFLLIFCTAILPAIFEELAFRGVLLNENTKFLGIKKAAIFSSLCFGIMHMNIRQFIYTFLLGIFIAYIYDKTKSILSTITVHFVINFTQVMLGVAIFKSIDIETLYETTAATNAPTFMQTLTRILIVGIIILPIFVPICKKLYDSLDSK